MSGGGDQPGPGPWQGGGQPNPWQGGGQPGPWQGGANPQGWAGAPPGSGGQAPPPWNHGQPAGPPPRKPRRRGLVIALVTVPAVVLAGVAAVVLTRGGSEDPPAPDPAAGGVASEPPGAPTEPLWAAPAPVTQPYENDLLGSWVTESTAVRAEYWTMVGHDLGTGEPTWERPAPEGSSYCAVSAETHENRVFVVHGEAGELCNLLSSVDLDTGETVWEVEQHPAQPDEIGLRRPAVTSGVVLADYDGGRMRAFSADSGEELWDLMRMPNPVADPEQPARCSVYGFTPAPDSFYVHGDCRPRNLTLGDDHRYVARIDAATGEVRWQTLVPESVIPLGEPTGTELLSTDPPVLGHFPLNSTASPVVVFDPDDGSITHDLVLEGPPPALGQSPLRGDAPPHTVLTTPDSLLLRIVTPGGGCEHNLTRIDVTTGAVAWEGVATSCEHVLLGVEDGEALVISNGGSAGEEATLIAVALADGSTREIGPLAADPGSTGRALSGRTHRHGDSIIVFPDFMLGTETGVLAVAAP
ncbi:PQQ-binding-like beta-propeller repeat protein [Actinoalloteichus caeruleus]|uniref:outer membrane protein assembly factor BamB family protein n=1 Tax=Actinoalloteichus cyanogriseus TaxID=2893586 RepID=UPI003BB86022